MTANSTAYTAVSGQRYDLEAIAGAQVMVRETGEVRATTFECSLCGDFLKVDGRDFETQKDKLIELMIHTDRSHAGSAELLETKVSHLSIP